MGNCTVKRAKASKNYVSSIKITVPDLSYLNRREKTLLIVKAQESTQVSLKKKIKIFRDSCISVLHDSSIIVAGGSDSSSSLTNWVFQIFPFENFIKTLPQLPIPSKFGNFLKFERFLYYVGGICEATDYGSSQAEQGTPICRLDLEENKWDVYSEQNDFNPDKYLRRSIMSSDDKTRFPSQKSSNLTSKDIYEPGSAIVLSTLYLIGGKIFQNDQLEASDKIFSFNLTKEFILVEETLTLPVRLSSPSCYVKNGVVCVAGGFLWNMAENLEIFLIDFEIGTVRKVELDIDRPLEPRYPILMDDKGTLCFSPPKMMYLREDKQQIFVFSLPTQVKYAEIEVRTEKIKEVNRVCVENVVEDRVEAEGYVVENRSESAESFVIEKKSKRDEFMAEVEMKEEVIEGNFEIFISKDEMTESKSGEFEQKTDDLTKETKTKCNNCKRKMKRISKTHDKYQTHCSHCKGNKNKYYCSNCDKILCKSCSIAFNTYHHSAFSILCQSSHKLCEALTTPPLSSQCTNCSTLNSPFLFCFICNTTLCADCFSSIQSLLLSSPKCPLFHPLSFYVQSSQLCSKCSETPKEIGRLICETCSYIQCVSCTAPCSLIRIIPCEESSVHEKLSYNFGIDESSLYEDSRAKAEELTKKEFIFADLDKREMPDEADVGESKLKTNSFATPLEEIKKTVLQKPLRGEKSPLVLSLSPKKYPSDEELAKKGLTAKFTMSPRGATIPRKSIGTISEERMQKYTANYYFPKPLNTEFRPSNFAEPSYKQQIEVIKKFLEDSPDEEVNGGNGNGFLREALEVVTENKGVDGGCPFMVCEEKEENFIKIEKNKDEHMLRNSISENEDQNIFENIKIEIDNQDINNESYSQESSDEAKDQEFTENDSQDSSDKVEDQDSTENDKNQIEDHNSSDVQSMSENERIQSGNQESVSDSSEIQLTLKEQEKVEQENDNESDESQYAEVNLDLNQMGSGPIDLPEEKESDSVSLFFPTLGDESEQGVAPVIDKHLALDKLHALKAKLNLLTEGSPALSVSSDSEKFNGFVIGKVKITSSEETSSVQFVSEKEFKDDLQTSSKDAKSSDSGSENSENEQLMKIKRKIGHSGIYGESSEMVFSGNNFRQDLREQDEDSGESSVYNVDFPEAPDSGENSESKDLEGSESLESSGHSETSKISEVSKLSQSSDHSKAGKKKKKAHRRPPTPSDSSSIDQSYS